MIAVNEVKSLTNEKMEVLYRDLQDGAAFIWTLNLGTICIKAKEGYLKLSAGSFWSDEESVNIKQNREVIPVDAELNWRKRDGGDQ